MRAQVEMKMTKTSRSESVRAVRANREAQGFKRVELWIRPQWESFIKTIAKLLNEETK
jgi:hypothetical protein